MKSAKYIIFAVASALVCSAMADILPPPEPLHRIGYEIYVATASALAILGGGFWSYIGRRRQISRDVLLHWSGEETCRNGWEYDFELSGEEKTAIADKMNATMPKLQKIFEMKLKMEMELVKDPSKGIEAEEELPFEVRYRLARKREREWNRKCSRLVLETLEENNDLWEALLGVPFELIIEELHKPVPVWFTGSDCVVDEKRRVVMRELDDLKKVEAKLADFESKIRKTPA